MASLLKQQKAEINTLNQELAIVISMVRLSNSLKYRNSGDSVPYLEGYDQVSFFNESEKYGRMDVREPSFESTTAKAHKKPKEKGKRDRDLPELKVNVIEHKLTEQEQVCPECGNKLHDMKVEVTRILKLVPTHFEVEEHRRHVYTCCECEKRREKVTVFLYSCGLA